MHEIIFVPHLQVLPYDVRNEGHPLKQFVIGGTKKIVTFAKNKYSIKVSVPSDYRTLISDLRTLGPQNL